MAEIISFIPILFFAGTLETAVFSRLQILYGSADLVMIVLIVWTLNANTKHSLILALLAGFVMTFYSALPMNGYFLIYLSIWFMIRILKLWVWQMPLILLVFVTIMGTLLSTVISFGLLFLQDVSYDISFVITQIFVPSMMLNSFLAFPTYIFLNDYANWLYQAEDSK